MHCLRYIYDFIVHFNNGLGIFTVVANADDIFKSVSKRVNSIYNVMVQGLTSSISGIGGRIDVIYTDLEKAFDSVPHKRLMSKL